VDAAPFRQVISVHASPRGRLLFPRDVIFLQRFPRANTLKLAAQPTVRKSDFTVAIPGWTTQTPAVTGGSPRGNGDGRGHDRKSKVKSTTSHDVEVGQRIRARRMAKGMSQTRAGDLLGVTFQQVQKYEKGVNRVGAGRLVRVAEALDVSRVVLLVDRPMSARTRRARFLGFLDTSYALRLPARVLAHPAGDVQRAVVDLVESIAPKPSEDAL